MCTVLLYSGKNAHIFVRSPLSRSEALKSPRSRSRSAECIEGEWGEGAPSRGLAQRRKLPQLAPAEDSFAAFPSSKSTSVGKKCTHKLLRNYARKICVFFLTGGAYAPGVGTPLLSRLKSTSQSMVRQVSRPYARRLTPGTIQNALRRST